MRNVFLFDLSIYLQGHSKILIVITDFNGEISSFTLGLCIV